MLRQFYYIFKTHAMVTKHNSMIPTKVYDTEAREVSCIYKQLIFNVSK